MRIFPGDTIGLIGNDESLSMVVPIIEANTTPQTPSNSSSFKLFNMILNDGSPLIGKTPRTSHLRAQYDALIVAVQRNDEFIDQDPNLIFAPGDILWIVGDQPRLTTALDT